MNTKNSLNNKRIVISTHVYAPGPAHALENYLKDKVETLLFIGHPFVYAKDIRSHYRIYKNGVLLKETYFPIYIKNQTLSLLKDTLINFILVLRNGKFDIFIGVDSANACLGILLKQIGLINRIIFYTIDYVPKRFNNKLLNKIYHLMDFFSVKNSNWVWNLSSIMTSQRETRGMSRHYRSKQIVVPIGTESNSMTMTLRKAKKYHVAHMGHIIEKQGIQLLIEAIPLIVKKIPGFHLDIIGGGDYEDIIKLRAKELQVLKYITFHGFVKNNSDVDKMLSYCELGIAPYTDDSDNYVRYTDPGKVKAYLSVGLPVIITKVPEVYKYLEKNACGIAVNYDAQELSEAISSLLLDRSKLRIYSKNAISAAKEFTWDKIFSKALKKIL